MKDKNYQVRVDKEGREVVQFSAWVPKDLKEWMDEDAKRCKMTARQYIERLIERRKQEAPEIIDYSF